MCVPALSCNVQAIETYTYDGILVDIDTVVLADVVGVPINFPDDVPARSHRGMLNHVDDVHALRLVDLENHRRVMVFLEAVRLQKDYFKKRRVRSRELRSGPLFVGLLDAVAPELDAGFDG